MNDEKLELMFGEVFRRIEESTAELKQWVEERIAVSAVETRRHFDIALDRQDDRLDLLNERVTNLGEKLDREAADIRTEMRKGFADTHDLIKFAYSDLDRRVTKLEHRRR
ncbi:MAG TPA: hypothetical protein VEU30_17450 [Thermoanaerobaculia bacterium]|nr:hypothetical protein [Thermoanaerobaculia bacterium]